MWSIHLSERIFLSAFSYLHPLPFQMLKFMLPLWAMLFVFHPMELAPEHDELHQAVSEDGVSGLLFNALTFTEGFSSPV